MAPTSELNAISRAVRQAPSVVSCPEQCRHVNIESDRQTVAMWRRLRLNEIVAEEEQQALLSCSDHRFMVRYLLSVACSRDPHRRANTPKWHALMRAADGEFAATESQLPSEADPYYRVVANLSSMLLWSDELRRWPYGYHTNSVDVCRERQRQVLLRLKETGKLFLS